MESQPGKVQKHLVNVWVFNYGSPEDLIDVNRATRSLLAQMKTLAPRQNSEDKTRLDTQARYKKNFNKRLGKNTKKPPKETTSFSTSSRRTKMTTNTY